MVGKEYLKDLGKGKLNEVAQELGFEKGRNYYYKYIKETTYETYSGKLGKGTLRAELRDYANASNLNPWHTKSGHVYLVYIKYEGGCAKLLPIEQVEKEECIN
ncbi:MAG: hypothetical protein ACOC2W_00655 [bacterium]